MYVKPGIPAPDGGFVAGCAKVQDAAATMTNNSVLIFAFIPPNYLCTFTRVNLC
jgi:hypothetical protein